MDQLRSYDADITSMAGEADKVFRARAAAAMATHGDPASWTNGEAAAFRDEVSDIMAEVSSTYGGATRSMASSLMEGVLSEQGVDMEVPVGETKADRYAANQSARYWASNLFGDRRDPKAFVDGCSAYVNRKVVHSRDDCILETVSGRRRKGPKMRYARIPMGPTCGFCTMLASRGFVYLTKESAGEYSEFHDHCNCLVMAGVEGLKVEGYDYEGMRARYRACRDALGTAEDVWREFEALPQDVRDSYGRGERVSNVDLPEDLVKRLGRQQNAFNDYYAHRITAEMDRRDRGWLYDGTLPEQDYSLVGKDGIYGHLKKRSTGFNPEDYREGNIAKGTKSKNEWRDLFAHDVLQNSGFRVKARPEAPKDDEHDGITSPDIEIDGVMWEIKSVRDPEKEFLPGNELNFIESQFKNARNKNFKNPYDYEHDVGMKDMRDETRVILNTRYRVIDATRDEIASEIRRYVGPGKYAREAIWIDADGNVMVFR